MSSAAKADFTKFSSRRQRSARTLRAYMALQNQEIAQRIKDLREARGNPPQPVVAAAVGVSLRTYQNWEAGDAKPEYRNLENLASYYGVSEQFILSGDTAPREDPVVVSERVQDVRTYFDGRVNELLEEIRSNRLEIEQQNELLASQSAILEKHAALLDQQTQLIEGMREAQTALLEAARRLIERATEEDQGEWDGTERRHDERHTG